MKQRLITSFFGIVLVLVWFSLRDTVVFNIIIAAVAFIAMFEALHSTKTVSDIPLKCVCLAFSITVPFLQLINFYPIGFLIVLLYIMLFISVVLKRHKNIKLSEVSYAFMMCLSVPFALTSLLYLNSISAYNNAYDRLDGFMFVILALLSAWIADSGALFAGKLFGKHKLAPEISPKKTIEGAVGGLVCVIVVFVIYGLVWQFAILKDSGSINFLLLMIMGIVGAVGGMIGDLIFSYIKREVGIKDFGNIMPGHGGLLDRIDSVVITAPITLLIVQLLPLVTHFNI